MFSYLHRLVDLPLKVGGGLVLSALLLTSCGHDAPSYARLEIAAQPVPLAFPGYQPIVLRWSVSPESPADIQGSSVFVHWIDRDGKVVRTFDHAFPGTWRPGLVVEDEMDLFQSALGPRLAEGSYLLTVGLLDRDEQRLSLETLGEHLGRNEYALGSVEIPGKDLGVSFAFEGEWTPVEEGSDRQILGRRWLGREGSIIVQGGRKGDRVLARFRIPNVSESRYQFVLDDGAMVPEIEVSTPCGQETVVVSGFGPHRIEPSLGQQIDGECRLSVRSNFVFRDPNDEDLQRSATLEVLSYRRIGGS